jgi:hypothetical protein
VTIVFDPRSVFSPGSADEYPFGMMISMPILCPTLKIDVLKMEHAFQTRYYEGYKVFYVYLVNWKGEEEFVNSNVDS